MSVVRFIPTLLLLGLDSVSSMGKFSIMYYLSYVLFVENDTNCNTNFTHITLQVLV